MAGTSCGRRDLARSAFRQRLVAIRYSQVRTEARPSNASRPRQAASSVSCTSVLGVLHRAEDPVAVQLQLAPVGVGELAKRLLVSRARPRRASAVLARSVAVITSNDTSSARNGPAVPFLDGAGV